MKNPKKIILPITVTALLLASFFASNVFAQNGLGEITAKFREVEKSFNNLAAFIEKNPGADSEILSKLKDYLAAKTPFDQAISNLSVADSGWALEFVANLINSNSVQIRKIQELQNGSVLSKKVSSALSKISDGLLLQNQVLGQWVGNQQKPDSKEKADIFSALKNLLSNIFKKEEVLSAIDRAWVDQTKAPISGRELLFNIEFKNNLPSKPPKDDFFIGFFIDKDNNSKTGVFIPGRQYLRTPKPGSEDVGADLFMGVKGKNGAWQPTSSVKNFKINKNLITFIVDLNNLASEFPWIAIASVESATHTRSPEIGRGYFLIRELQERDVRP